MSDEEVKLRPAAKEFRGAMPLPDAARMRVNRWAGFEAPLQSFLGISCGLLVVAVLVGVVNIEIAPRTIPGAGVVGMSWSLVLWRATYIGWPVESAIGGFFLARSVFAKWKASRSKTIELLRATIADREGLLENLQVQLAVVSETLRAKALDAFPTRWGLPPERKADLYPYFFGVYLGTVVTLFVVLVLKGAL
jgi:hypothetical protein